MAFYSSIPTAPPGVTWSLKIPSENDAKILAMWFNSSLNILQTLINRKETRGAFLQIDEYTLEDFQILNPKTLSEHEKGFLINVFEKSKGLDFPSILNQLKERFPARVEVDGAVLRVLGFGEDNVGRILDYLYPALANEIEQLNPYEGIK